MLNTEQALTRVLQIVHALGEGEAAIYNAVSKNPYEWKGAVGPIPQLYFLEQDLRRTLVEEAAAKSGNRSAFTAARRICDAAVARNSHRTASQGFWIDEEGKQCVCDGYRGFRLNSPVDLTAAPELSADGDRFNLAQVIAPSARTPCASPFPPWRRFGRKSKRTARNGPPSATARVRPSKPVMISAPASPASMPTI